jgi:hypothetical protein
MIGKTVRDPLYEETRLETNFGEPLYDILNDDHFDRAQPQLAAALHGVALGVTAVNREGAEEVALRLALGWMDTILAATDNANRMSLIACARADLDPLTPRRGPFSPFAWRLSTPHFLTVCAVARMIAALDGVGAADWARGQQEAAAILENARHPDALAAPGWLRDPLIQRAERVLASGA